MVSACKHYITEGGLMRVWDVAPPTLLERLAGCQQLFHRYQHCFHQNKKKVQNEKRPFEISEVEKYM